MLAVGDGLRKRQQLPPDQLSHQTFLNPNGTKNIYYSSAPIDDSDNKETKFAKQLADGPQPFSIRNYIIPLILTLISCFTHFYKISWADYVVWDEAHFGKFASHYIKHTFYFDVHPPLGKILLGLSGVLAGYDGSFGFESGAKYPEGLNYTAMRVFCAAFGAGMVPVAYFTGKQLKLSELGSVLLALMTLTDTALLAISRFILLDSMLLFFTCLSVYTLTCFRNYQKTEPFSPDWWLWLFLSGLSLGTVLSVKWVGLFAIALVGLHTLEDLWEMLGDLKMSLKTYVWHWIARVACLIIVPVLVYIFSFYLHFLILYKSGEGDAQMSSLFQANLQGNNFHENPLELAFGSRISLKNNGRGGGLLHSHIQRYPTGSEQQQVTCYHHKDSNNEFFVSRPWGAEININQTTGEEEIVKVKHGDIIRLVHAQTFRNLHSHSVKAPLTTSENEVSCYGNATTGDSNDHWRVEVIN
ncbi:Protein O-mannosyltransferase 2, partial [Nowakowskiella sp. JEL0078]